MYNYELLAEEAKLTIIITAATHFEFIVNHILIEIKLDVCYTCYRVCIYTRRLNVLYKI